MSRGVSGKGVTQREAVSSVGSAGLIDCQFDHGRHAVRKMMRVQASPHVNGARYEVTAILE